MAPPEESIIRPIAHIRSDFSQKFGIPRQSGLIDSLRAQVVFLPEYREPEAFRGLEEYSHLWLIWQFSQARREGWSPTVRPPRLGGNIRKGVFATLQLDLLHCRNKLIGLVVGIRLLFEHRIIKHLAFAKKQAHP